MRYNKSFTSPLGLEAVTSSSSVCFSCHLHYQFIYWKRFWTSMKVISRWNDLLNLSFNLSISIGIGAETGAQKKWFDECLSTERCRRSKHSRNTHLTTNWSCVTHVDDFTLLCRTFIIRHTSKLMWLEICRNVEYEKKNDKEGEVKTK